MTDPVYYDEFGLFHENAAEYGLPFDRPPTVRRAFADVAGGRRLSAQVWQDGSRNWSCCTAEPRMPIRGTRWRWR